MTRGCHCRVIEDNVQWWAVRYVTRVLEKIDHSTDTVPELRSVVRHQWRYVTVAGQGGIRGDSEELAKLQVQACGCAAALEIGSVQTTK
jgi:hypothetical protein